MEVAIMIAAAIAVIWKVVDGIKLQFPRLPAMAVQGLAWATGVGVAFLLRWSDLASSYSIGELSLSQANIGTTIILGFALGSSSSATVDLVKAVDNTRTSAPATSVTNVTVSPPESSMVSRSKR